MDKNKPARLYSPMIAARFKQIYMLIASGVNKVQSIVDETKLTKAACSQTLQSMARIGLIKQVGRGNPQMVCSYKTLDVADLDAVLAKVTSKDRRVIAMGEAMAANAGEKIESAYIEQETKIINGVPVTVRTVRPRHSSVGLRKSGYLPLTSLQNYEG